MYSATDRFGLMQRTPADANNNNHNSQPPSNNPSVPTGPPRHSQAQSNHDYPNYGSFVQQAGSIGQPSTTRTPSTQTDSSDLPHSGHLHMTPIPSMYTSGNVYSSRPAVNAQNPYQMNINTLSPLATTSNMYSSAASLSSASSQGATAHNLSQSPSSTTHTSGAALRENRATFTAMTGSRSAPYTYVDQSNAYVSAGPGMPSGSDAFTGSHANRLDVSASADFTGLQTHESVATTFVPASSFPTDIGSSQYESGFIDPTELARRYDLDAIAERERASAERAMTASRSVMKASASPGLPSMTKSDTASSRSHAHPSQGSSLQFITEDPTSMARVVSNSLSHHRIDPQARLRDTNKSPCARCKRSHIKCNISPPYSADLCEACSKKKLRVCEGGSQLFDM